MLVGMLALAGCAQGTGHDASSPAARIVSAFERGFTSTQAMDAGQYGGDYFDDVVAVTLCAETSCRDEFVTLLGIIQRYRNPALEERFISFSSRHHSARDIPPEKTAFVLASYLQGIDLSRDGAIAGSETRALREYLDILAHECRRGTITCQEKALRKALAGPALPKLAKAGYVVLAHDINETVEGSFQDIVGDTHRMLLPKLVSTVRLTLRNGDKIDFVMQHNIDTCQPDKVEFLGFADGLEARNRVTKLCRPTRETEAALGWISAAIRSLSPQAIVVDRTASKPWPHEYVEERQGWQRSPYALRHNGHLDRHYECRVECRTVSDSLVGTDCDQGVGYDVTLSGPESEIWAESKARTWLATSSSDRRCDALGRSLGKRALCTTGKVTCKKL